MEPPKNSLTRINGASKGEWWNLVDTQRSGRCDRKIVGVQISPRPQI